MNVPIVLRLMKMQKEWQTATEPLIISYITTAGIAQKLAAAQLLPG
jgi:hypothetical protein